jgi:hypothetical protein
MSNNKIKDSDYNNNHYSDENDRRVGIPRGPEVFGASVIDSRRDELKQKLEEFEKRVDFENIEQVQMLNRMKEETRELERNRGIWNTRGLPGVSRDWNDATRTMEKNKREEPKSLIAYNEFKRNEEKQAIEENIGPNRHLAIGLKQIDAEDVDKIHLNSSALPAPGS